jgi:dipeptidyl aminopeptidase/acylaminoacyl peptidase
VKWPTHDGESKDSLWEVVVRTFIFLALFVAVGCSSASKKEIQRSSIDISEISSRPGAPAYPFEEFYKTSGITNYGFSPDGKQILFLKTDGKSKQIYQYDINTKKSVQLTKSSEPVGGFVIDKQGHNVFFQQDKGGSEVYDIYLFDLKSKSITPITKGNNVERSYICDVSKDGLKLYFSQSKNKRAENDIKVYELKSGRTQTVLESKGRQLYCDKLNKAQDQIVIYDFVENNEQHIGVLNLKGNVFNYILQEKGVKNFSANFQRNKIHFLSTKDSDQNRVWTFDQQSSAPVLADFPIKNNISSLVGYSDGAIFSVKYRGELTPKYALVKSDLKSLAEMPFNSDETDDVVFSETNPTWAIFAVEGADRPTQYFFSKDSNPALFYDSNQSKIQGSSLAKAKSLFVTSFDGLQVPVHFIIPNGTSATNKKPAIMWVHGGPEDNVDPHYSALQQYLVNSGFVLVAPNARGSTGFGKAYQFKDNGDWGGGHIKDLVAVANFTKSLDFIDSSNVFIVGGSFGGFSVMSLITQYPTVFKAAVDIFGLVEMASFMKSWPPLAQQYWIGEMGADPRIDENFNKKISPIYHVDKIRIPLQVHQGSNDIRVEKSQSDQLVKSMQDRGIPVDYHIYPDEGHGFLKFDNTKKCFTSVVDFYKKQMVVK